MKSNMMIQQKTHVLVIGAGYAGMLATMRLAMKTRHQNVQITLINPSATFFERLRMHQYAANQPVRRQPIREILSGSEVQFIQAEVTGIDIQRREVITRADNESQRLAYDYLMYTPGSSIDHDGVPGVREHAYTLSPTGPRSAEVLKGILPAMNRDGGHLVVVGGGPTGIEAAAEFAESYPGLKVTLVTRGEVAGLLGGKIQAHILKVLTRLGVAIRDQSAVERVEQNELVTGNGETIRFDLCLWAGGFVVPTLARESGLAINERGQVLIDPYMRSISNSRVYAAGDSAQPVETSRMRFRMAAYTAAITGAHAADSLYAAMVGKPQKPLNFAYLGQGIALGRHEAAGFNNFPDDIPKWPMFTGEAGVYGRELFVNLLGSLPVIERRLPGLHFWPVRGKAKPVASLKAPKVVSQSSQSK